MWNAQDNNPFTYSLYRNGSLLINASWSLDKPIQYPISNITEGQYNFTLIVQDQDANTAIDTIWMTISQKDLVMPINPNLRSETTTTPGWDIFIFVSGVAGLLLIRRSRDNVHLK